jgi:hypothetical protein
VESPLLRYNAIATGRDAIVFVVIVEICLWQPLLLLLLKHCLRSERRGWLRNPFSFGSFVVYDRAIVRLHFKSTSKARSLRMRLANGFRSLFDSFGIQWP